MFEKSRKKIVAAIMSVLTLLFLGMLAVIYTSSYYEVASDNYKMLERHVELYNPMKGFESGMDVFTVPDHDSGIPAGSPEKSRREESHAFRLSTFYTVTISPSGDVLMVDNGSGDVYDENTLIEYALKILSGGRRQGIQESLIYHVEHQKGYSLVAFMDNTLMQESMSTLFRYTLVFGSITLIGLYFFAAKLARRIVQPLEESYEKQKQFISDAGHELKTPISVISANAELLTRENGFNQWLSNIQYENERMGKLVAQLLELARTENVAPLLENIDFSRLTAGEALPFESVAFEHGITLYSEIDDGLHIEGDEIKLRQLVSILIDNAIHHNSGTEIHLTVKEEKGAIVLSVCNQGPEIPVSQREQIFERFYRSDAARCSASGHYGLGLAIAKAIVEAHKGRIELLCHDGLVEFKTTFPRQRKK